MKKDWIVTLETGIVFTVTFKNEQPQRLAEFYAQEYFLVKVVSVI